MITFTMFKIIGGQKTHNFELKALSNAHARTVATDFHNRLCLIGRYYCETSDGDKFSV
jgi:hypothetical protein